MTVRSAVFWGAVLVLFLPWARHATGWAVFEALEFLLATQCHRLEGRVLELFGTPMAVCSRCAGIYAGVAWGAALARPSWTPKTTVRVVVVASIAMVLEATLEAKGSLGVVHPLRLATGAALSWPVSSLAARWIGSKLR